MQNKSHAVMAQRTEPAGSLDDFPTPPWATRALIEYSLKHVRHQFSEMRCAEPACGVGYMARTLKEYFYKVDSSDIFDYGYGDQKDFLTYPFEVAESDWVITNPPFKLAEQFVLRALSLARGGVAILARTVFLESIGRYTKLFLKHPPSQFAQFTERVPMIKGRLSREATTATGYGWLIWEKSKAGRSPELTWIPPCRKLLERDSDYEIPAKRASWSTNRVPSDRLNMD